jgi:adenosine/AMP kinase
MLRIVRKTLKICEHANDHCVTRLLNIRLVLIMDFGPRANPRDFFSSKNARIFSRKDEKMELSVVRLEVPEGANLILGQSHFIKTAEDLYEVVVNTVPGAKFAVAFNEASGPCLVRVEANDDKLRRAAVANAQSIGAGHAFVLMIRNAYPINLLSRVRDCFEVCSIFCATANPVEVIMAQTELGRSILGVVDGSSPKGVESADDARKRREFVRKIGYKL